MARTQSGADLRHLFALVEPRSLGTASDGQLLDCYSSRHDEAAFASLVRRHGPMVLSVCRRVLARIHDAEDVFQATFLVLARKGGSIRKRESVASWLHGVAQRLAVRAKTQGRRRETHERQAGTMRTHEADIESAWHELQQVLDESLRLLPEKYRTALVLCYLEGRTQEEAARQLL